MLRVKKVLVTLQQQLFSLGLQQRVVIEFLQRRRFQVETLLAYPVSYWAEVLIQERAMTLPYQVYTTQSSLRHLGLTTRTAKRICRRLRHLDLLDRQDAMYWAINWCYEESFL